jgi:hypothetical protein
VAAEVSVRLKGDVELVSDLRGGWRTRLCLREGCQDCAHLGCGSVLLVEEAAEGISAADVATGRVLKP